MTKNKVWALIAAASTVGLVAYAASRRASASQRVQPRAATEPTANALEALTTRVPTVPVEHDAESVAFLRKAPALVSADDVEALDPDDLGRDWLARAAQSEPSLSEADLDLEVALDEIADPTAEAGVTAALEADDA